MKPFERDFEEEFAFEETEHRGKWRWRIGFLILLYSLALVLLSAGFRFVGEQWWLLGSLLYLPSYLWLLPMAVLLPLAVIFCRRGLLPLAVATLVWLFWGAGFQFRIKEPVPEAGRKQLTVVTCNVAEANGLNVGDFVRLHSPDVILLQGVSYKEGRIDAQFPEYQILKAGAYHLLSRYPIKGVRRIEKPSWRGSLGVIFEIEWEGQTVELYSVHVPTLRTEVDYLLKKTAKEESFQERLDFFRESMQQRVRLARDFSDVLSKIRKPMIVAGDFNMPANGALYHYYTAVLQDAFAEAGRGFGYTCPAYDPHVPTPFGPWLRIDYLFCNQAFRPIACEVETDRPSQHRGVCATFEWVGFSAFDEKP